MDVEDLIAPVPIDRFMKEYFGRQPLHIPAAEGSAREALLDWERLNALLAIRSHWTQANLKLVMNSRPVQPDFYLDEVATAGGPVRRADAAKVELFLAMGASLVADAVEDISPGLREVVTALGERFAGRAGANVYCSCAGVQAFASHCDSHEVFAVQCEGEKVWNIYSNRAAAPVEMLDTPDAQAIIESVKGPVALQVRMRPGDLLYIPRGFYHDALASSGISLHVTFSVAPPDGRILFRLLEALAVEEQAFREYLPDARLDEGERLNERLEALGRRIQEIIATGRFAAAVADRQRGLTDPDHRLSLPERPKLEFFARSEKPAAIVPTPDGAMLQAGGRRILLGHVERPALWLVGRAAFSLQELFARFRYVEEERLRALAREMCAQGLFFPYTPQV